jgi:biotin operon repressor
MRLKPNLTDFHYNVLRLLKEGHSQAIHGDTISQILGIDRRSIRGYIEDLTMNGYAVCNYGDGKGYFLPETAEELERMIRKNASYKNKFLRKDYALKTALKRFMYSPDTLTIDTEKQPQITEN